MKKIALFLAIAMMCIAITCGCAAQPADETPLPTQAQDPAELPGEDMSERVEEHAGISSDMVQALPLPAQGKAQPGEELLGVWQDAETGKAVMTVYPYSYYNSYAEADEYYIEITLSEASSATDRWEIMGEYDIWYITGKYEDVEDGRITSDEGCSRSVVNNTGDSFEESPVYSGGSAHITFVNGNLYWHDAQDNVGDAFIFERVGDLPEQEDWESEEGEDPDATEFPPEGEELLGEWIDTVSQRATMTVEWTGTQFYVVIHWPDSAYEATEWRMHGDYEDVENGRIAAEYCDRYRIEAGEDYRYEEFDAETGHAHITYVNDMLYWFDAEDATGEDCMFERMQ